VVFAEDVFKRFTKYILVGGVKPIAYAAHNSKAARLYISTVAYTYVSVQCRGRKLIFHEALYSTLIRLRLLLPSAFVVFYVHDDGGPLVMLRQLVVCC